MLSLVCGFYMLFKEFEKLLNNCEHADWIINPEVEHGETVKNKDRIALLCKNCGDSKLHMVGNIKYTIFSNPKHCKCTKCTLYAQQIETCKNLLNRAEEIMKTSEMFSWSLDRSRLVEGQLYDHKTPLPLICKTCQDHKMHSLSNIVTAIRAVNHIRCQTCKIRANWQEKIRLRTNSEYELDTGKTIHGFKVIHHLCGNYYYVNNFKFVKKGYCPYCINDERNPLSRIKDKQQFTIYIDQKSGGQLKFHEFSWEKKILLVSCNRHSEEGTYKIGWKSFLNAKQRASTILCPLCIKQRLRRTNFYEYNQQIADFGLKVDSSSVKIDKKEKIWHWCTAQPHHPGFYASAYEVLSKNKRCLYCYNGVCYQKDYDFMKTYIEMDKDRFFTHSGRKFRLLSTREEIECQVVPGKPMAKLKIRINELTCQLHDSYEITWGSFYYRNASCTKCKKEAHVSYAHNYYQALLAYFGLDYIPEFPLKLIPESTYRIDFKLFTFPNYLEIDSSLHVDGKGWSKNGYKSYQERDRLKDLKLMGNIERIKLYDDQNRPLPINAQLKVIELAFLARMERNGVQINIDDLINAKQQSGFFRHARISYAEKRLAYFHADHIEFNFNHFSILEAWNTNEMEFHCKINNQSFKGNFQAVCKLGYLCPVCVSKLKRKEQLGYYLDQQKIKEIIRHVDLRFNSDLVIDAVNWANEAFFYMTIVFPVHLKPADKVIYISIRELVELPIREVKRRFRSGKYNTKKIKGKRKRIISRPAKIYDIESHQRKLLNVASNNMLAKYQTKAKLINRLMKRKQIEGYIEELIVQNEECLNEYIHKSASVAKLALGIFDRTIVPFFDSQKDFNLLTLRNKYVSVKQNLLIQDLRCGHSFYCSWNWAVIRSRNAKGIQCQNKSCFDTYYKQCNPHGNKIAQEKLLKMFKQLFHGQYYPVNPAHIIMVREKIDIIHLPTGDVLKASFDNFRRGKFRSAYKKFTLEQLQSGFPTWTQALSI